MSNPDGGAHPSPVHLRGGNALERTKASELLLGDALLLTSFFLGLFEGRRAALGNRLQDSRVLRICEECMFPALPYSASRPTPSTPRGGQMVSACDACAL